jgi:hypothetical protein
LVRVQSETSNSINEDESRSSIGDRISIDNQVDYDRIIRDKNRSAHPPNQQGVSTSAIQATASAIKAATSQSSSPSSHHTDARIPSTQEN